MEVSDQLQAPATLSTVPIGYEIGWAPEPVWTRWRREKKDNVPLRSVFVYVLLMFGYVRCPL
jgi:hypothetical protein